MQYKIFKCKETKLIITARINFLLYQSAKLIGLKLSKTSIIKKSNWKRNATCLKPKILLKILYDSIKITAGPQKVNDFREFFDNFNSKKN